MATLYLVPIALVPQWFSNLGVMASNGTLQTYTAGTTTPATTYTDNTGLVANPNPMTLSANGRPVSASGAPVSFWVLSGTVLKIVVYDSSGTQLQYLDNVAALDDPAAAGSVLSQLASASSSNASGVGPVAGVDLVANAVKSYDVIADLRAANQPTLASGQTLNAQLQGGTSVNDGLGGDWYWNATSTATDNGTTVVKPNATTGAGRWLRLYTPPFGAQSTIIGAATTDLGTLATNIVLITGATTITSFGSSASIARPLYFLQFAAAGLITYNATSMILPGGTNIICETGDSAIALYLGSGNWQILSYFRTTASPVGPLYIDKPTTQSIINSTVLTNDTALTCQLVGGTYLVQLRLLFLGLTTTTQGYKVALGFTGTVGASAQGTGIANVNGTPQMVNLTLGGAGGFTASTVSDTTPDMVSLDFVIPVSATGQLTVLFAQTNSSANATQLVGGSVMTVTKVV